MGRIKIVPGLKFHRLTVVGLSHVHFSPSGCRRMVYLCRCECKTFSWVQGGNLTGQHPVKSCGCLQTEVWDDLKANGRTHGMRQTRTYQIWANAVARGRGSEQKEKYFDRGIRVCRRWLKFENFFADMGDCPDRMSIDRIDNNKGYNPKNCRYATYSQQARNTRRTFRVTYKGETLSACDLAERHGIHYKTFYQRLKLLKWSLEKAITTPVRKNNHANRR